MPNIGSVVLLQPDGTAQPMNEFAGRPAIVQILRYYG